MGHVARNIFRLILAAIILILTAWASLALWYRLPAQELTRASTGSLFCLIGLAAILALFSRRRQFALVIFFAAFTAVVAWWTTIKPKDHGDWAPEVARQVTGTIDGDVLTLRNVRDFDWRSETDFTERWTTRKYDLTKLRTLDLFMDYWAAPEIAHTILSFGFEGSNYLAWSIEVRRLNDGEYSPLGDLFKKDPLVIIAADERDVIRLRTKIRQEDIQLYRLRASPEIAGALLREYVADANGLANTPQFYNSLTSNCTTTIFKMMRIVGDPTPFNWRFVINGYLPDYAYARGAVDTKIPLPELKALAHIDKRAAEADGSLDFSRLIRVGAPSPHEPPTP